MDDCGTPRARYGIKQKRARETFNAMHGQLKPILGKHLPYMAEQDLVDIAGGVEAILTFHAHINFEAQTEDAFVDLTYDIATLP